ncbi:MAG: hypothetical protein OXN83_02830, partial [Oligoflexia bacterium]|nr:hypothetical protein [Oligoflexia bacterium]
RIPLEILSTAIKSPEHLDQYLKNYGINQRAVETGETLLHLAVKNFKLDYVQSFKDTVTSAKKITQEELNNRVLTVLNNHHIIEQLLLLSADPHIYNKLGHQVIHSFFFETFIKKSLELQKRQLPIIYYQLNETMEKWYSNNPQYMRFAISPAH